MSLAVEIEHMMLELNYIVVPNNIEIGVGGLSQIFCGRLWINRNVFPLNTRMPIYTILWIYYSNEMGWYLPNLVPRACDPREGTRGCGIIRFREESAGR